MLRPFDLTDISSATAIWNAACGPDLAITERAMAYNARPATGAVQAGRIALHEGRPAGFVLASALPADPATTSAPEAGWVDAIAVHPDFQRRGIGAGLLAWAEDWLAGQGCVRYRLGGSLHPFAPGLPSGLPSESFFRSRGYAGRPRAETDWDVARSLRDYRARSAQPAARPGSREPERSPGSRDIAPGQPGDETAVLAFFRREFPGRWRFEFEEFLREGGRLSDYVLLWTERGVDGFARLTFEDSERPLDRFFMHRLPRPWGQLGPIGVSGDTRGKGYGGALLDAGLCRLRDLGVNGCVIDWTSLVDFYGKFGFRPHRRYEMLVKW